MKQVYRAAPVYAAVMAVMIVGTGLILEDDAGRIWQQYHPAAVQPSAVTTTDQISDPKEKEMLAGLMQAEVMVATVDKSANRELLWEDWLFSGFTAFIWILMINSLLFTRVVADEKGLKIYYPLAAAGGFLAKPTEVSRDLIRSVKVVRTTPAGPDLTDLAKLNWRDVLVIDETVLPGYVFAGMGNLYKQIIAARPEIKPEYRESSPAENLSVQFNLN